MKHSEETFMKSERKITDHQKNSTTHVPPSEQRRCWICNMTKLLSLGGEVGEMACSLCSLTSEKRACWEESPMSRRHPSCSLSAEALGSDKPCTCASWLCEILRAVFSYGSPSFCPFLRFLVTWKVVKSIDKGLKGTSEGYRGNSVVRSPCCSHWGLGSIARIHRWVTPPVTTSSGDLTIPSALFRHKAHMWHIHAWAKH